MDALAQLTKLQDENARLREQLSAAEQAAEAAKQELQAFVYAASHDVKESLRSVSSYAQLLIRQAPPDPEFGEFGHFVMDGVKTAVNLLDRMNSFCRIDPNPRTSTTNLGVLVQLAVLKLQPSIRESGAQVTVEHLPDANVNEGQFTTVFENLIDNAIRYRSSETPRIIIAGEETDDGLLVSVQDNGSGIQPEYHEMVFAPFKRLHAKDVSGIGLGLAACRKILAAHGGRIWVESDGRNGSKFLLLLPY